MLGFGHAQSFTGSYYNAPLNLVLEEVSSQCNVKMAYDFDLVAKFTVTAKLHKVTLSEALQVAFENTPLTFIEINGVFVIKPDPGKLQVLTIAPAPLPPKYKVMGLVREKLSGETLPYASISLSGTQNGVAANSDGYFSIITQQADSLLLSISYLGYLPAQLTVSPANQRGLLVVELDRQVEVFDAVMIAAPRSDVMQVESEPSRIRLNSARITELPSLSELDITAPIQLLPGIDGTTESMAGLSIRKSGPDENLVLYDGFTVYKIDHFFGAFSSFNAKAIKDVQVFKGGYDATYGGRASGVVEITGKSGSMNKTSVDVGMDLLSTDVTIETPVGKRASFIISGRRSFTDKIQSSLYESLLKSTRADLSSYTKVPAYVSNETSDPSFYYYDLNTKLTINLSSSDVVSMSGYKGRDKLTFFDSGAKYSIDENSDWGSSGMSLRWARQWSSSFSQTLVFGGSRYNLFYQHLDSLRKRKPLTLFQNDTIQKQFILDSRINDVSLTLSNSLNLNENNSLDFGFSVNSVKTDFSESSLHQVNQNVIIDTTRIVANDSRVLSVYAQNTYSNGILKLFKTGIRVNRHSLTNKTYFEPRVQIAIAASSILQLKASAGRYHQFINRIPMVSATDYRSVWAVSDGARFPVVISDHYIAGFSLKPYSSMSIDVEGYSKFTDGLAAIYNSYRRTATNKITLNRSFYKYSSTVLGLDVMLKQNFGRYQLWLAYTLSKASNESKTINGSDSYPAYDDQLHELKIFGVAKVRRWNFSLAWIYGSGKPWDAPTFTNSTVLSPSYSKNSERLPAYQRLDLAIGYAYNIGKVDCKVGMNIVNVLDISNILGRPYQIKDDAYEQVLQGISPLEFSDINGMGRLNTLYFNFSF
ncbi:TonB-dependent receptor [Williamwhitmania taraxaci]|nr:TonB-dependent receptor [Williamwhitmania taraxaci]